MMVVVVRQGIDQAEYVEGDSQLNISANVSRKDRNVVLADTSNEVNKNKSKENREKKEDEIPQSRKEELNGIMEFELNRKIHKNMMSISSFTFFQFISSLSYF